MGFFSKIKKSCISADRANTESVDEYEVPSFEPKNIAITSELLRRKREDELRELYCEEKTKTGDLR